MTFQGHQLFTIKNGQFRVAALLANGSSAVTDPNRYASEASATLAAKKAHFEKPFINYVVVQA